MRHAARSTRRGRSPAGGRTRSTRRRASARCAIRTRARALLAGRESIPCYLEPIRAFHAVTAGLQLALDQLQGLEAQPLELTAAMRIMVDDPDTVAAQWLGGKDPFAAARGGDNSDDARIRALSGRRAD